MLLHMIHNKFKLDKDLEIKILKRHTLQDMSYSRTLRNICKVADLTCQRQETRTNFICIIHCPLWSLCTLSPNLICSMAFFLFNAMELALLMVV